jgi:hypothetical protein
MHVLGGILKRYKHVGLKVKTENGKNYIVEGTVLLGKGSTA